MESSTQEDLNTTKEEVSLPTASPESKKGEQQPIEKHVVARLVPVGSNFSRLELKVAKSRSGATSPSGESEIKFGRLKSIPAECRLTDSRVSSTHCRVFVETTDDGEHAIFVEDLSTNGTFVNGEKVGKGKRAELQNGDELSIVIPSSEHKEANILPAYVVQFVDKKRRRSPTPTRDEADDQQRSAKRARAESPSPPNTSETHGESSSASPAVGTPPLTEGATPPGPSAPPRPPTPPAAAADDKLDEHMSCGICTDIMYKCVTLYPCMHNFCNPCYSQWMEKNKTCPQCRADVQEVRKNHMLVSLIDAYLSVHPEKKRSEEECKALDPACKITDESLRVGKEKKKRRDYSDSDDGSEGSYDSDEDSDDGRAPVFGGGLFGGLAPAPRHVCQECRDAGPDGFKCGAFQHHVQCVKCWTYMPFRNPSPRPAKCSMCLLPMCFQYWGHCGSPLGVLKKLKEHVVADVPVSFMNHNATERQILMDYVTAKGMTVQQLFEDCAAKLEAGTFKYEPRKLDVAVDYFCTDCVSKVFSSLAVQYRCEIPKADLPAEVAGRGDCWYGVNCRTQSKEAHAKRLNHACKQTKF